MQQQQAAKGQLLFHQEETISHLQPQHEEHHGGGTREVPKDSSCGGTFGDTNRQRLHPLRATWLNIPYAMQTRVPSGSVNRRLAPRGRWSDGQDSDGVGGRIGLTEAKHGRMDDICYTMF
ncbi:hypothetical protein VZT92_001368 [Zoarces viviparus]